MDKRILAPVVLIILVGFLFYYSQNQQPAPVVVESKSAILLFQAEQPVNSVDKVNSMFQINYNTLMFSTLQTLSNSSACFSAFQKKSVFFSNATIEYRAWQNDKFWLSNHSQECYVIRVIVAESNSVTSQMNDIQYITYLIDGDSNVYYAGFTSC